MSAHKVMKPLFACILFLCLGCPLLAQDQQTWTNSQGKSIEAQFVEADASTVTLLYKGQRIVLQLSTLNEESQGQAAELRDAAAPTPTEPGETPEDASGLLEKEHQWKNTQGKVITAKFVRSDGSTVTISMAGREIPYPLANLSPESRELAAKLSKLTESTADTTKKPALDLKAEYEWVSAAGRPVRGTFVSADAENVTLLIGTREYPMPLASLSKDSQKLAIQLRKLWEDSKPKVIQGVGRRMAYFGSGDWKYYNTVFQSANFDAAIHYSGISMHVWFKDRGSGRGATDGARIGSGKPIAMNFNMRYYDKSDGRTRHRTRKVVSLEKEWEVSDNVDKCIKIVRGVLDNNATFEVGFDFNHKTLGIWGKVDDPSSEKWPTRVHVGVRVPRCINYTDEMRAKDWDPLLGDAAIHITPVEGKQARLPLNVKWDELRRKYGHTNPAKNALVFGKPWGNFKLRVTPRTVREASFRWGKGYTGVFPFQGFYFGYHMSDYAEIPRAKRLDLIVYR